MFVSNVAHICNYYYVKLLLRTKLIYINFEIKNKNFAMLTQNILPQKQLFIHNYKKYP